MEEVILKDPLMSSRERLETIFSGGAPDRTPILGGWIACPEHICTLTEVSIEEYWKDPIGVSIQAYERLGTDGLVSLFVPRNTEDFRCVDVDSYVHARSDLSLEEAVVRIDAMSSPEEIEATPIWCSLRRTRSIPMYR